MLDIFHALNSASAAYNVLGFVDEDPARKGAVLNGSPVIGGFDTAPPGGGDDVLAVCGVGDPAARGDAVVPVRRSQNVPRAVYRGLGHGWIDRYSAALA